MYDADGFNPQEAENSDLEIHKSVSSLFRSKEGAVIFSRNDLEFEAYTSQLDQRTELSLSFEEIVGKPEDTEQILTFCDLLGSFLKESDSNARLLLYLPYSIFPETDSPIYISEEYQVFTEAIRMTWFRLLYQPDLRAAFDEGDYEEEGKGTEWVRKAAHLLPFLYQKGFVNDEFVLDVYQSTSEVEIKNSIQEGLHVCYLDGLSALFKSKDADPNLNTTEGALSVADLISSAWDEYKKLLAEISEDEIDDIRHSWLDDKYREDMISKYGRILAEKVTSITTLHELLDLHAITDSLGVGIVCDAYARIIDSNPNEYSPSDLEVMSRFLINLSTDGHNAEYTRRLMVRMQNTQGGIVESLKKIRSLALLQNRAEVSAKDYVDFEGILRGIEGDPVLSQYLYPSIILYGSRVKGYARINSDFDVAVFVKPSAPQNLIGTIASIIKASLPQANKCKSITEYWVDHSEEGYSFLPKVSNSLSQLAAQDVQSLFLGQMIGAKFQGFDELLSKYVYLDRFGEKKELVRNTLLKRIEADALQSRFLHRGFRDSNGHKASLSISAEGFSEVNKAFWDENYRTIATSLFLDKVFLPQLQS